MFDLAVASPRKDDTIYMTKEEFNALCIRIGSVGMF